MPQHDKPSSNIRPAESGQLVWNPEDTANSLRAVASFAEDAADKAIAWYWQNKKWKARLSGWIRLGAMGSTALAGLIPVIAAIVPGLPPAFATNTGLAASVLVGLAAALIGVDKAFGLSSGWARFVLTATTIRKGLQEFRLDWTLMLAKAGASASSEDVVGLLQRAKEFTSFVEGLVLQETKEWIAEFQSNIAQLEKETQAQLESLKAQADKTLASKAAAAQPASVEIVLSNADKVDNRSFQVLWEGTQGKIAQETVNNAGEWIRINVPAGQYTATVSAAVGGKTIAKKTVVVVSPGEQKQVEVTLPIGMAAAGG
jgi:hypothetical protein